MSEAAGRGKRREEAACAAPVGGGPGGDLGLGLEQLGQEKCFWLPLWPSLASEAFLTLALRWSTGTQKNTCRAEQPWRTPLPMSQCRCQ